MKTLTWLISMLLLASLAACGSDDDDEDDPNDDSIWTVQSTGIKSSGGYPETLARVESGNLSASADPRAAAICTAFDAEGGSNETDSQMEIIEFTDATEVTIRRAIYLDDTTCDNGFLGGYDYADQIVSSYTVSSSSFDFNRIDFTVSALQRHVLTSAGAATLNAFDSDTGACGKTDWQLSTTVNFSSVTCDGGNDTMDGIHYPLANDLPAVGEELEGVYILSGDLMTLALDAEGSRPTESNIASMTSTGLSGSSNQPMYSRQ